MIFDQNPHSMPLFNESSHGLLQDRTIHPQTAPKPSNFAGNDSTTTNFKESWGGQVGRGWLLFKRRLLVLLRLSTTSCGSNHCYCKISSSFDTGGGDWQILGEWYSRRDERTRTCKRNREKITTTHMLDDRVRRIASGNSR